MDNKFTMELVWHSCTDCLPEENYNPCLYVTDGKDIFEVEWENPPNGKKAFYEACPWPDSLCIKPNINSDGWWWADLYQAIKGEPKFKE